jgi:hypothetical protein
MSDSTQESTEAAPNGAQPVAAAEEAKPAKARKAFSLLKRHPLGIVAFAGAAIALVEVEVAVGILAGIGATALLATKSGPEARQEVLAKGKWAIERVKGALPTRAPKAEAAPEAAATPAPEGTAAATPEAAPPAA